MQSLKFTSNSSGTLSGCCPPSSSKYCTPSRPSHIAQKCRAASAPVQTPAEPQPFFDDAYYLDKIQTAAKAPRYIRQRPQTFTPPSIRDVGTLRPGPEWYPAWMKYRRRDENYVFWQDKFSRCSIDVPEVEKRWTLFSTVWFTMVELKFFFFPPAIRFLWFIACRSIMARVYEAHKALVLWQCKLDAHLASKATSGKVQAFSKTMALRRLHWKNCLMGEALYMLNVFKTGRINLLPPVKRPLQRPTFFWLF